MDIALDMKGWTSKVVWNAQTVNKHVGKNHRTLGEGVEEVRVCGEILVRRYIDMESDTECFKVAKQN